MKHSTDALSIVLTPVQLSAILARENVSPREADLNRLNGGLKIVGGAVELIGAAGLLLTPEPTMVTKAGGVVLGVHGSDSLSTGARQIWTGVEQQTVTEQASAAAARSLGASDAQARKIGAAVDIVVPLAVASILGAARIGSVRAGRIALAEHEMAGGHTIARHVGRTETELRARLLSQPRIPAATSFASLGSAEAVVTDALRANVTGIQAWAGNALTGQRLRITYDAAKSIGYGIVRGADALRDMQKVILVLEKTTRQGKIYFVLTAYPIL